jgi:hypothetical protein
MRKRIFYGVIVKGKLVLDQTAMFREYTSTFKEDTKMEFEIRKQSKDPSTAQWAYLYANVYREVHESIGISVDDVDLRFKRMFMKEFGIVLPDGLMLTKTTFDRVWLARYVDSCIRYAAELGVTVAPPRIGARA